MRSITPKLWRENIPQVRPTSNIRLIGIPLRKNKNIPTTNGVLQKCDKMQTPETTSVHVLKGPSLYSTKEEISSFISDKIHDAERDIAAKQIQDFWKLTRARKQNSKMRAITRMIKLKMRPEDLKSYFHRWVSFKDESKIRKVLPSIDRALSMRENFGSLFWTFHVLKRMAIKAKHPQFLLGTKHDLFISEWNFFDANIRTKTRYDKMSRKARFQMLGKKTAAALHNNAVENMNKQTTETIQTELDHSTMRKALKALKAHTAIAIFIHKKLNRICYYWYSYIDKVKILRSAFEVYTQRVSLKSMSAAFKQWGKNGLIIGCSDALVFENIQKNRLKLLPYIYLLKNDMEHFTFSSSFFKWSMKMVRKRLGHSFITFVLNESKSITKKRFAFDCIRYHATQKTQTGRYRPFQSDDVPIPSVVAPVKSTLFKFTQIIANFSLKIYTSNSTDIRLSHFSKRPPSPSFENMSSNDIRTILYHLIVLTSMNFISIKTYHGNNEIKKQKLLEFQNDKNLNSRISLIILRKQQQLIAVNEEKAMRKRMERDQRIKLTHESHDTSIAYSKIVPRFTTMPAITLPESPCIATTCVSQKELDACTCSVPQEPSEEHPLLQSIDTLVELFRDSQREFRRTPKDVFPNFQEEQTLNTQKSSIERSSSSVLFAHQTSVYETFVPIVPSIEQMAKLDEHRFLFNEFGDMIAKRKAIDTPKVTTPQANAATRARHQSQRIRNPLPLFDQRKSRHPTISGSSNQVPIIASATGGGIFAYYETEFSFLALGYSPFSDNAFSRSGFSFLTRKVLVVFDQITNKKNSKHFGISACAQRVCKFLTKKKKPQVPTIKSRKPLYYCELLETLVVSDTCASVIPGFTKEFLLCVGEMSSLMEQVPQEEIIGDFYPYVDLQNYARKAISNTPKRKPKTVKANKEPDEDIPTDYDARLFGFASIFFLPTSITQALIHKSTASNH